MATIGQQLLQPEEGWKRYDDRNSAIQYYNGAWIIGSSSSRYLGTETSCNTVGATISFHFLGKKLRILDALSNNKGSNIEITIDGIKETFSSYSTTNSSRYSQTLVYEKTGLSDSIHIVDIVLTDPDVGQYLSLDAIDIDSEGRILHPDEVIRIKDLEIGKRIRCNYQATPNSVGVFSGLGKETSDFIPVTSSNVPNGDFYWIMVDDENMKKKLIADRNIQHSISWDTLNNEGFSSGNTINMSHNYYHFSIRLLNGGISGTDRDNEWDKYIVGPTHNENIITAINNVWNWSGIYSWLSTTNSTLTNGQATSNRNVRGASSVERFSYTLSESIYSSYGFRPVLIIEDILKTHTLIKHNYHYKTFKDNQWKNISMSIPSKSIFINEGINNMAFGDRRPKTMKLNMDYYGVAGKGKVFKSSSNFKKIYQILKIEFY